MKNLAIVMMFALGLTASAQVNKNITKETRTTTTTVNNGTEKKKLVKNETRSAQQELEFKDAESKKLNKDLAPTPVAVTSSTTISGDGIPTQEIDRSSYYTMNGQRYQIITDKTGYRISTDSDQNHGVLRKTSDNNYIYRTANTTSYGHFDRDGNLVLETYDDKTDGVTVQTFTRVKP